MEYAGRSMEYVPPSRVAKMAVPSPRARPGSTAVAVATARRSEYGSGGSILPVLTPTNSANASKRGSWVTTPRSSNDTGEDDLFQSAADSFAPPPRRAEVAAARRSEAARQRPTDALFASEAEQSQLAYMEQMYGTINLLNAELEHERRRNRAAPEAAADRLPASQPPKRDYNVYEEDTPITYGEFDDAPSRLVVAETPVAPSYSPRRLRAVPSSQPSTQHRVARPPVSPRTAPSSQDEELCATLGKNAELHIRSKDMERIVQKTELELELARKHIKMTERRAESREEKLRELLKEKLQWQKELKATRAQVVEEKMRQVDLFRDVEAAKRQFAADIEALEQDQRADQEENAHLRSQANEMRAQLNFQARKMEDMARQAQDEKERFVALVEDTRRRFREWKEGEAAALEAAREQAVRKLKTEYELKIERHLDEKQKLRDKVNDLEVSMQLLQKDRTLSPLELTLRKTTILGSKDNSGIVVAEQIETQSRILELENLLAHSQEYQARQAAIIKLSESTISRLMQEREVTALENLSLHPLGMESQRFRPDDNLYDADFTGSVAASSPVRRGTPPVTPSRNRQHGSELPVARSPRSRSQTPRRGDLEASILSATPSDNVPESAPSPVDRTANQSTINGDVAPTTRELELMKQLAQLRQELSETQAKSTKATCSNVDGVEARNNGEVASNIAAVIKEAVEAPTKDDVVIDEKNIAEAPQENSAVESEATSTNIDKLLLEEAKEPVGELSDVPEDPNVNEKWQTDSIISTDATETELHRVMESEPMSKMTTAAAVVSCSASSNLVPANEGHPNNQHNDNDGSQEDKRMDSSFLMGNDLVDAPAHNYEVCDEDGFCKLEGAHTLNYEDFSQPPQDEEEVGCPVDPELAGENLLEGTEADTEDLEETTLVVKSETILGNVNADGEADLSEMSKPPTIPLVEMSALEASSENADVSVGTGIEIESWDMTPISLEKTTTNHGTPIPNTDIEDNRGATIAQLENPSDDCKLDTRISANTADTVTGFAATESPDTASAAATEEAVNELKEEQQFPTTSAILSATLSQCDVAKFQATEDEVQLTPETSNLDSGVPLSSCTPDTTCVAESFVTIVGCAAIALVNSSSQGNAPSREGDIKKFIGRPESAPIDPPNHVNPTGTTRADCNEPGSDTKHEDDLIADEVSDATDTKRLAVDTVQQNNMDEQCGAMDAGGSDLAFAVKDYTETERFQAKELAKMFVEEVLENFPVTDYHAEIADGNKENSFDPSPPTEFEEASVNFGRGEARSLVSTAVFEADQVAIQDPPAPASLRAVESPLLIEAEKYAESKRVDYPDIDDMCGIVDGTIATDAETGTSGKSGCNADVEIEAHHDTKSSEENLNDLAPNVDTQAIAVDEIETKSLSLKSGSYTEEVNNQENEKFHFESQHRPNENCTPSEEFKVSNAIPIESVSSGAVSKTEVPISTDGCNSCTQDIATTVAKFFASQIIAEVVSSFPRHNENNNTEEDRLNRISDSGSDDAVDVESTSAALNEMLVSENTLPVNSAEAKQPLDAGKNDLTSDQPFCSTDKSVDINNENGSIPKTALLSTGTVNKEGTIVNESAKALIGAVIAHVITSKDSTPHENGTSAIDEEKAAINEIATELVDAVKELVDAVIAHVIANKELMPHVNITPAINSVVNMNGEGEDKAVEPLRKTNGIAVSTEMAEMALTSANDGTVEICDSSLQVPLTGVAEECNFKEPCRLPADNQDDVAGQNIDLLLNDVIDRVEQSYNAESLVPSIGVACNNSPLGAEDIAQTSSTNREVSTNNNRMPFPDSTSAVVIAPISLDANGEVMHALQVVDMPKIADIIVTEADDGAYQ
ncbi:hypothetical protein PHYBOEH_004734 [Phytophthora boehmeriae]|uniref:Uncharacterized protein n=1 Tax=Phytophthora boehmeriae TaxID=109152 RepID=A0A8T1X3L9_9STRA|nr:hypothetical protein PHYBOEH_004734 [Phytophthora boehmeriae]